MSIDDLHVAAHAPLARHDIEKRAQRIGRAALPADDPASILRRDEQVEADLSPTAVTAIAPGAGIFATISPVSLSRTVIRFFPRFESIGPWIAASAYIGWNLAAQAISTRSTFSITRW